MSTKIAPGCAHCGGPIDSPRWPAAGGGDLCQNCWEADNDPGWWEMLRRAQGVPALTPGRD